MPVVPLTETDGDAVRAAREAAGLSRPQLAAMIGYSTAYLNNIENGYQNAGKTVLEAIAAALRVDVACLTYTGPLTLLERARTPAARRYIRKEAAIRALRAAPLPEARAS